MRKNLNTVLLLVAILLLGYTAFLIDSQTGAVWQYEGRGVIGDEQKNDPVVKFAAHFARMPIGGLDGWSEELMWEMILEKQQKMRESREQRK